MGTELFRRGWPTDQPCPAANHARPDLVRAIHADYAAAGAQVLCTNTFQARSRADFHAGLTLAQGHGCAVWLAVGPTYTAGREDWTPSAWWADVAALAPSADALLLETVSDAGVAEFVRTWTGGPIWLALTYQAGTTRDGHAPAWWAERATDWGLTGLGVNCVPDAGAILTAYRAHTHLPLLAKPNTSAGMRSAWQHPAVAWVGGCCGTTPADVRACQ
jgi:methionine synthase I (cobalamin-dependent)